MTQPIMSNRFENRLYRRQFYSEKHKTYLNKSAMVYFVKQLQENNINRLLLASI